LTSWLLSIRKSELVVNLLVRGVSKIKANGLPLKDADLYHIIVLGGFSYHSKPQVAQVAHVEHGTGA